MPVEPLSETAGRLLLPVSTWSVLPVGLATAVAAMVAGRFSRFPAVPYSFIASLAGVSLALTGRIESDVAFSYILSWFAAPVLCALLAAGIYRLHALSIRNKKIHLAILDARLQGISIVFSFLLLAAFSVNYSLLFSYLPQAAAATAYVRAAIAGGCAIVL